MIILSLTYQAMYEAFTVQNQTRVDLPPLACDATAGNDF